MRITLPGLILSIALTTSLFAQDESGLPVSKDRLLQALQYRAFTSDQILTRVQARGVDFEASDPEIKQFRQTGASPRLLNAIRSRYVPPSEVKPHVASSGDDILAGPPLTEREVVLLLKARVKPDQIANAVAARGVEFALNKAFNQDIWGAGGNLTLMGEILLCSRSKDPAAPASDLFPVPEGPGGSSAPTVVATAATKPKPVPAPVETVIVKPKPAPAPVETAVLKPKPAPAAAQVAASTPPAPSHGNYVPVSSILPAPRPTPPPVVKPAPPIERPVVQQMPELTPEPDPVQTMTSGSPRRIEVDPALQATKLLVRVPPVYPSIADRHPTGLVRLEVLIDRTGKVVSVKSLKGDPRLVMAAESAVRRWTYRPTVIATEAVEVLTQVEMIFSAKN